MKRIAVSVTELNYEQIQKEVHSLKGTSGYAGAARVHYACYYIQEAHHAHRYLEMIDRYPQLVEAVVEFRRYMRKYIHDTTAELRKYLKFPD
jgi:HPt (histidine-containing phosphotransfer) domain-containing protein